MSDGDNDRGVVLAPLPSAVVNTALSWKQLGSIRRQPGHGPGGSIVADGFIDP